MRVRIHKSADDRYVAQALDEEGRSFSALTIDDIIDRFRGGAWALDAGTSPEIKVRLRLAMMRRLFAEMDGLTDELGVMESRDEWKLTCIELGIDHTKEPHRAVREWHESVMEQVKQVNLNPPLEHPISIDLLEVPGRNYGQRMIDDVSMVLNHFGMKNAHRDDPYSEPSDG